MKREIPHPQLTQIDSALARMAALPSYARYGLALLMVSAAMLLRLGLVATYGELPTFITFYPVVALAAMFLGPRAGIFATLLSALAVNWFVMLHFRLTVANLNEVVALALFTTAGMIVSWMAGQLDLSRRREGESAERERAREQLILAAAETERQRKLLEVTLESIGDGVIVTDVQGRVTFLNGEAEGLTGWTSAEAAGQPLSAVFNILDEQTRRPVESPVDKILHQGTAVGLANHTVLIAKDGREIPIDDSGAPVRHADGSVQGVVLVFRDFTERKTAESALRKSEATLRGILDATKESIWLFSPDGYTLMGNRTALERWGESADSILNKHWNESLPAEVARTRLPYLRQAVESRTSVEFEDKRAGMLFHHNLYPVMDADGHVTCVACFSRDITKRKAEEDAVRKGSDQLRLAMHAAKAGMWEWDLRTGENSWSPETYRLYGQDPDHCRPSYEAWRNTIPPQDRAVIEQKVAQATRLGAELNVEWRVFLPAGPERWLISRGQPIRDENGAVVRYLGIVLDITERKKAEEALFASEERLRLALAAGRMATWDWHVPTGHVIWNDEHYRMMGYRPGEVAPSYEAWVDRIHPDDRQETEARLRRGLDEGAEYAAGFRALWPDGTMRWVEARGSVDRDEAGNPLRCYGVMLDLTEHKRLETELNRALKQLQLHMENSPLAVIEWGPDMRLARWTGAAEKIFGWKAEEVLGKRIGEIRWVYEEDTLKVDHVSGELRVGTAPQSFSQNRNYRKDGTIIDCEWYNSALVDSSGGLISILSFVLDVTERQKAQQQLKTLNETLEQRVVDRTAVAEERLVQLQALAAQLTQAEQKERQRLATILHDHLQQLLVGTKFHLGMLRGQSDRSKMGRLIDQIDGFLDQSLEASRNLTIDLSPPILTHGNMTQVLEWLADWMSSKHGLKVKLQADPETDPQALEIRVVLFQATRELLFNVVKHAKINQATVKMERMDNNHIRITVCDQGQGFDTSKTQSHGRSGTGFGLLAITERLDWFNGSFQIESEPGKGTCATLSAPVVLSGTGRDVDRISQADQAGQSLNAEMPSGPSPDRGRIRVLLADDHAIVRDGLSRLLESLPDMEVVGKAADGQEAVDMAIRLEPDVVIMDVSMPVLDGVTATRRIMAYHPQVRVIGLSMFNEEGIAESMKAAGACEYLAKTSGPGALIAAVRGCR
jgi:PAS domain S-box-containing protein